MITEEAPTHPCPKDETSDREQRQLALLTDPNYGTVLSFLEKFRAVLDLPFYSFQRLEDHLLHRQERVPARLIDFHFILLKRLSLAKNTQRDKFDSILTKFVSRFDFNDSEYLTTHGYLHAEIPIKIRILKNLLESQFDLNQTLKNTLIDQSGRELKCTPLGRDRFGVSYWFFMDTDCFVRLFREDADIDRSWTYVAKDRDELEKFIQLLITDSVVRKKFPDWTIDYEPYGSLTATNDFEQRYLPAVSEVKVEEINPSAKEDEPSEMVTTKKRGRQRPSAKREPDPVEVDIKQEEQMEVVVKEEDSTTKKRGRARVSVLSTNMDQNQNQIDIKEEAEQTSNDDEPKKRRRGKAKGSAKLSEPEKSPVQAKIKQEEILPSSEDDQPINQRTARARSARKSPNKNRQTTSVERTEEAEPRSRRTRKRSVKIVEDQPDVESTIEEKSPKQEEPVVDWTQLGVRRSSRPRKATSFEPSFAAAAAAKSPAPVPTERKKRPVNGKAKPSNDVPVTTNARSGRSSRRRKTTSRRNVDDRFCLSSSSSEEHLDYLSEDDYDSDDYLPDPVDDHLFDLEEEVNPGGEELRTAKTAQASTVVTACRVCAQSDRPEVLLLCDDCDDAYHIECLRPALISVPDGDWFCPLCEQKKLSDQLISKLKELLVHYHLMEQKRLIRASKQAVPRKIRRKEYSSDESITASETEEEQLDQHLQEEESMLSASQANENSNLSSSNIDETNKNISQRGRHRRTRFDMNKMLNNHDGSEENSSTDQDHDDEYVETAAPVTNFDLQLPKKMTRLLHQRYRPLTRTNLPARSRLIRPRLSHTGLNLNENLDSPLVYVNGDGSHTRPIKSVVTNSKQTLKIVRRWNDVQRRSRLKCNTSKGAHETTSDCADENSVFCPDDTSPPRSNESQQHLENKEEESAMIIRSKVTLVQSASLLPIYKSSTRNLVRKNDVNFDRLTRDIQYAVSEANNLSTTSKTMDQQQTKRTQKSNFSPYFTKVALRPLPVILPKPASIGYKIFKSKDPPGSMSTTADLSNIILTPSSSSSLLDTNDEQSATSTATNP